YVKALEDLENDNGRTKMNAWVDERVEEGSDEDEAIKAFEAAKAEYDKESEEFTTDTVNDFNDREEEVIEPAPVHQAGNVINYEGVEIRDNGNQYVMVANEQNPNITIKGSDLKEVEQTYDSLWRDISKMEDKARKMGMTVYHDALLWADDYDKFVRAYGGHEENLPVIIDLDKMKNRYGKTSGQPSVSQSKSNSWLEPYKHEINSKYMMTPYQLSRLSPEQRSQWENFSKRYPGQYVTYSEAPSLAKINRSKRQ
ncbi:MAG: hypothetical protein J6X18_12330, partial [Bacteroidales bacterium]|nr:hypothetical protein [Bacteroidales bacterium]